MNWLELTMTGFAATGWLCSLFAFTQNKRVAQTNLRLHDELAGRTQAFLRVQAEALDYKTRWGKTMRLLGLAEKANHELRHRDIAA